MKGKKIILGVCAGIAAYKAAFLTRLFVKAGAEVKIVMTPMAKEFISPLTMSTLSKNPVHSSLFNAENGEWTNHVALGEWADLMLIAPLTANSLAKMANGLCDNLLLSVYLSAKCPVAFAPAMDLDMFAHPSTKANIQRLQTFGNHYIAPESGELASGLHGEGRLPEPESLFASCKALLKKKAQRLKAKTIVITGGPTRESIDPVRFITNHSTGTMSVELAKAFLEEGAAVTFVHGPLSISTPQCTENIPVTTAEEMFEASNKAIKDADLFFACAAVADYRPKTQSKKKIKKSDGEWTIPMERTRDILGSIALQAPNCLLGGFALETHEAEKNAQSKLKKKKLDFIVLNKAQPGKSGFGKGTNQVTIFSKKGKALETQVKPKSEIAREIVNFICENFFNDKH